MTPTRRLTARLAQTRLALPTSLMMAAAMTLSGCAATGSGTSALVSSSTPDRVVMQIINNSCDDDEAADSESLTTGQVKGLSKVLNGFGIPYDEKDPNWVSAPRPISDDSYEANKTRGIGYAGLESHYPGEVKGGWRNHQLDGSRSNGSYCLNKAGKAHFGRDTASSSEWDALSDSQKDAYVYESSLWDNLTPEEELYGCCMRWEYAGYPDGDGLAGYYKFIRGSEGHRQYVAIHALKTDKWVIACPFDFGPDINLPIAGSENYGRIGGVSPEVADALGFGGHGEAPDEALTEWWWVDNSDQVSVGPVGDLSQFENGGGASASPGSAAAATNVTTAIVGAVLGTGDSSSQGTAVAISPANENSFVRHLRSEWVHGDLPSDKVRYIVLHDTEWERDRGHPNEPASAETVASGWEGRHIAAHFIVDEDGTIVQCVPIDKIAHHAGWAGHSANSKFDVPEDGRDDMVGSQNGNEDYGMSSYSIGIELCHMHNEGPYPEAQLNALDRLISYIDQQVGHEAKIIDHKEWASQPDSTNQKVDVSDDFPLDNYKATRNHNAVETLEDAEEARERGDCSDDAVEDAAEVGAGTAGDAIAALAVRCAGTACPDDPGDSTGILTTEPTDAIYADYVAEKKKAYPGDTIWASCCRMSVAVKGSGADESFPVGPCSAQWEYCSNSPKWQTVGQLRTGDRCDDTLKPGDVLIWNGPANSRGAHTMIYVGNEAIRKKFPSSNANFVEAHYNSGYPRGSYQEYVHYGDFTIFRLKGSATVSASSQGGSYTGDADALVYMQADSRWASKPYQGSCDIQSHGCGCCASAMLLTLLYDQEITPDVLASKMMAYADPRGITYCQNGVGTVYGEWSQTLKGVFPDLEIKGIGTSWSTIKSTLESGSLVIWNAHGTTVKTQDGGGRYTNGHVLMAYKADGDKIWTKGSSEGGHISYTAEEFAKVNVTCAFALSRKGGGSTVQGTGSSKKATRVSRYFFVGDSRTVQMGGYLRDDLSRVFGSGALDDPSTNPDGKDEFWVAQCGAGYDWFVSHAIPAVDSNVRSGDAIIIWLGVNGAPAYIQEYADTVNQKAKEWEAKGATVYYASVGPRHNMGPVEKFNEGLQPLLSSDITWIDVYGEIIDDYVAPDGLHYDKDTYQHVYDCMVAGVGTGGGGGGSSSGDGGPHVNVSVQHV